MEPESLEIGSIVEGTVTGITSFGAFVELPGGTTGLVHISEIADEYVVDVRDHVREQEIIQVRVLKLNEKGKYDLSIRRVHEDSAEPKERRPRRTRTGDSGGFEDLISRFKKDSEERQSDVRRNREARRGGSRKKKH